jgi:predicted extracellular nuclease
VQRAQQATVLHGFVDKLPAADKNVNVIVSGDLNDYPRSLLVLQLARC